MLKEIIDSLDKKIDVTSKFVTTFFIIQNILNFILLILLCISLYY